MSLQHFDLTGEQLLNSVRRRAIIRIVHNIIIMVLCTAFFIGIIEELISDFSKTWFFLFTTPAWLLAYIIPIKMIRGHYQILQEGDQYDLFRRFGSPEQIAEVISDPSNIQLLPSKRIILTKAYFMIRGDYVTYLPLEAISAIRLEITHYRNSQLKINVKEEDGKIHLYQVDTPLFSFLSDQKQRYGEIILQICAQYAPHICVNY